MKKSSLRPDLQKIADLIHGNNKVFEIGCGDGELLDYLTHNKHIDGRGMEISQQNVSHCVDKGLSVIQGDADIDLQYYPDNCFDFVISSQTIQATENPKHVISEMARIGKKVIISIPNFGYWYNRFYLMVNGRMPVSSTLSYQWYETPNIHFCTIRDFEVLCQELDIVIEKKSFLGAINIFPNLLSEYGIFVLSKKI